MKNFKFILLLLFCHYSFAQTSTNKSSDEMLTSLKIQTIEELVKLKEIDSLSKLKKLDILIDGNQDIDIPKEIFELKNLENLSLHFYGAIDEIFPNLNKLENLKYLWIEDKSEDILINCNTLTVEHLTFILPNCEHLSWKIENANELSKLHLASDKIRKIDLDFGVFENLSQLIIRCQNIQEIPVSIGKLKNLSEIDFYIKTDLPLPESFSNLTKLKKIRYGHCRRFPLVILNLTTLEHLNFDRNYFTEIPNEISNLVNLKELELSFYQGTTLCEGIGNLPKLEYLSVSYSNLEHLPNDLSGLHSIDGIDLGSNINLKDKTSLLKSLQTCKKLRFITLSSTGLTTEDQEEIRELVVMKK